MLLLILKNNETMKAIVTTVSAMLVAFAIQAQEPAKKPATQVKEGAEKVKTEAAKRDMPAAEKAATKVEKAAGTMDPDKQTGGVKPEKTGVDAGKPAKPAADVLPPKKETETAMPAETPKR
jgi:hypothetical protein